MIEPYTFTTALMRACVPPDQDPQDWLRSCLAAEGIELQGDELLVDGELLGFQSWLPPDALPIAVANAPCVQSPFVGPSVGGLTWTHIVDDLFGQERLVPALVRCCRGAIVRNDTGELRTPVVERAFELRDLLSEYGLEAGEAFFEREPGAYLDYVMDQARAALTAAGFDARVELSLWKANPLALGQPLMKDGEVIRDVEEALIGLQFRCVAFDWRAVRGIDGFWYDP